MHQPVAHLLRCCLAALVRKLYVMLQEAKKEAMNQVREELLRQFGRASGIVAEVQSDDGKGNIVVDVTQVNTSSVHAANND